MNRPRLILLCGIPGSGKTTYAKTNAFKNDIILSSDSIRKEFYGDESIQKNPVEVFTTMQKKAVEALNDGRTVWYDATNMTRKDRSCIINVCPKFAKIECHIIWAPIEICITRDAARERTVGKEVIDRMLKRFQAPYYDEGISKIKVVRPDDFNETMYIRQVLNSAKIPHDNPHHTLNIYDHCMKAYSYGVTKAFDWDVYSAALYHDIGKPYVKSFRNTKGELSDSAHYYQHQCVSAYMIYGLGESAIEIAWLVSTHMDPFLDTRYYNSLSPYLKKMIDELHECDLAAH